MTVFGSLTSLDPLPVEHPGAGQESLCWDNANKSGLYQQFPGCSCDCRDKQVPSLSWSLPDDSSEEWVKTHPWTVLWSTPAKHFTVLPRGHTTQTLHPGARSRILILPGRSNRTLLIMKLNTGGRLILSAMKAKCQGEKQATTKTLTRDRLIPTLSSDSLKYEKLCCSQVFA